MWSHRCLAHSHLRTKQLLRASNLPDYRLNDVFAGRLITFLEGPLANHTFRVIRYFGTDVDAAATAVDNALAGCLVIDLSEMGTSEIEFNGANGQSVSASRG